MRFLAAILILSAYALGQEGIPDSVRTGKLPLGLEVVANIDVIKKSRIDALKQCVEALKGRHERGMIEVNFLLSAQRELTAAQLDATTEKHERLDFIQNAFFASLMCWQRIDSMHRAGMGELDAGAQARAEVFRYRAMWLEESNQESDFFPQGLGVTDIHAIRKSRIDALKQVVKVFRIRSKMGLTDVNLALAAQTELAIAQLDSTIIKQERLDFLKDALVATVEIWQRLDAMQKAGSGIVSPDTVAKARAEVFRNRAMWLEENNRESDQPLATTQSATDIVGLPVHVGTGEFPPGLVGVTDIHAIRKSRIDALTQCVAVLKGRLELGLDDGIFFSTAQMELAIAQRDMTNVKQERLDCIQHAFVASLMVWQRLDAWIAAGGSAGGSAVAEEAQARAEVFRYRAMWLEEKAREIK